ncbi:MAG: HAD family hydrolase [Proteobacteria bacterium]|nr:MAG: HAD family hydrolase [Pseudomonadota bacterium]
MSNRSNPSKLGFDAVIFDMDGVVTDTALLHSVAWKELFDAYLEERAERNGEAFREFDAKGDYLTYVDGKPRYKGVQSFLESRGIDLPSGDQTDGAGQETVCGLGNAKDAIFERLLHRDGPKLFHSTIALIHELKAAGVQTSIISSSKHCQEILQMAGVEDLFVTRIDGVNSEQLGLKGKPDADIFTKSAEMLGVPVSRSVVVEDAVSGVQAGRAGGFALVLGIDRGNNREALMANGADFVVNDLAEINVQDIDDWFNR